jgi:tetratricopeptide (TPR) repeat protein
MNKLKYIGLFILLIYSFTGFAQNLNVKELKPFILIEKGDYHQANILLDQLIKENPKQEFQMAKIEVLYKLKKHQEAIFLCKKVDQQSTSYSSVYRMLIYKVLDNKENFELSLHENLSSQYKISLYDLLTKEEFADFQSDILNKNTYSDVEKQLYQAENLVQSHNYSQALFLIDEIISRNPTNANAYFLQSKISYFLKDYRKSNFAIDKAISLERSKTEFYRQKVNVNIKMKNYSGALENTDRLIRKDPYVLENYILKLNVLVLNSDYVQAVNISNSILELSPENVEVLQLNSKAYFKTGDNLSALKSINKALEIEQSKEAYEIRGDIYMVTNTYKFAVSDYSMYLDIEPYNGEVYAKKGFARLKLGDQKGACSDWVKAKRYGSYQAVKYIGRYCK